MSWEIIWHSKAAKVVENVPSSLAQRIFDKIDEVAEILFVIFNIFKFNK